MFYKILVLFGLLSPFLSCQQDSPRIERASIQGITWNLLTPVALSKDAMRDIQENYWVSIDDAAQLQRLEKALGGLQMPDTVEYLDHRAIIHLYYENGDSAHLGVGKMYNVEWNGKYYDQQEVIVDVLRKAVPEERLGLIPPFISDEAGELIKESLEMCGPDSISVTCLESIAHQIESNQTKEPVLSQCLSMLDYFKELVKRGEL